LLAATPPILSGMKTGQILLMLAIPICLLAIFARKARGEFEKMSDHIWQIDARLTELEKAEKHTNPPLK